MIHRGIKATAILAPILALSACTLTTNTDVNQNRWIKREVDAKTLKNGQELRLGYQEPSSDNQCKQVGMENKNWADLQFKGQFSLHLGKAGYVALQDVAVAYANAHPNVNYAYMSIPNTTSVMGINLGRDKEAIVRYYSCKNPPAKHSNM